MTDTCDLGERRIEARPPFSSLFLKTPKTPVIPNEVRNLLILDRNQG
jgi:hypothetical protein